MKREITVAGLTSIINSGIIITQVINRKDVAIKGKGRERQRKMGREGRYEAKG